MLAPEQAYQFTRAQDLASQHFEVVTRSVVFTLTVASATNAVATLVYTVPQDRTLFLSSWGVWTAATVDINNLPLAAGLSIPPRGSLQTTSYVAWSPGIQAAGAAGRVWGVGGGGQIVVPGGSDIYVTAQFTFPVTTGDQGGYAFVSGVSVPKGNALRG